MWPRRHSAPVAVGVDGGEAAVAVVVPRLRQLRLDARRGLHQQHVRPLCKAPRGHGQDRLLRPLLHLVFDALQGVEAAHDVTGWQHLWHRQRFLSGVGFTLRRGSDALDF